MKLNHWIKKNVDFSRGEAEVRDNKGYGYTLAAAGFIGGVVTGIAVLILQMIVSNHDTVQTLTNIVSGIIAIALLAYMVYLLLPFYQSGVTSIGGMVLKTIFALACLIVPFIIGVYAVVLMVIVLVALGCINLALKSMTSSSDDEKKKDYDTIDGPGGVPLEGDRIDNDTFVSNGVTYKRTYEGFCETWKRED